jgi:hypothetical protein
MEAAIAHFRQAEGWTDVEDVSAGESYDLLCRHPQRPDLRVEVKGTRSAGESVFLTRNEVAHARSYAPNIALFVLSDIHVVDARADPPMVAGGTQRVWLPWRIDDDDLTATVYQYVPPGTAG